VPASGRREPFLLPPMAPAPDAPWLVAAQHNVDANAILQMLPGLERWPTGRPGWPAQQPLEVVLGASALGEGWSVTSRLITPSGREVDKPEVVIGDRIASSDRLVFHRATIGATDLPAGEYRLVVRLADSDSGQTAARSLPVIIHTGESPLTWTDPSAPRRPPRRSPRAITQELSEEMLKGGSLRVDYLAALSRLADGDVPGARRALARLERRVSAMATSRSWTFLRATQWETARRFAESRPDSLMATILFHREMYRWYGARYESELAEHSWHLAVALIEESAKLSGWQAPEGFAEGVLLDLASDLATAAHVRPAQYLLEVALDLTPDQPEALLGLGALHERAGEPKLAVRYLEDLVDVRADHHEARLRLAVNRRRLGNRKAAERLLEDLLTRSAPSWIQILAYQELAGLMIRSEYYNEAEQLLLRAIEDYPRNQRLRILLAYVLDMAGRPGEATAVIERLEAAASQHSTSPRHRYGAWPDLEPKGLHEVLAEGQRRGVEALREVLP
jgi:tetratricopeptide (TPR) repeat protein